MKILLVCEFFPRNDKLEFTGGVEAYNYYLAKFLAITDEVIVICRRNHKNGYKDYGNALKVIPVGPISSQIDTSLKTIPGRIVFFLQALKIGLQEDFDVVQGNNFVTYLIAYLIGFFRKKPKIAWYPDVFIGRWIILTGFLSGVIGEIVERIYLSLEWDHFIALSRSTEKKLLKCRIDPKKISTIYAGIDTNFLDTGGKRQVSPNSEFIICCVCRLVNYKRVDLVIAALKILIDRKYNLKLNIIGDGSEKKNLLSQINILSLKKHVLMESNLSREELGLRYKNSDLFCLASEQEGFGMVVIEAAAAKVPYVISDIDVFKEITQGGKGGFLFKQGSAEDLAKKIEKICINKLLRNKLSDDAYDLSKQYTWFKIAQEFKVVYEKVTKR